jgi:predicted regulator of Ras-like GTPase activity (Roadblock/LC7/MglB family)
MATSVKSKFAGFLRGLMGRPESRNATKSPVTAPAATPAPTPAPSAFRPAAAPAPVAARSVDAHSAPTHVIEVPLAAIVAAMPVDLRSKLAAAPTAGKVVGLPADTVLSQLAFGAVKISFGELRQLIPGAFANSGGENDHKLISLPLQEILARINPVLLSRRPTKKVEVAEEIVGPFAERGRGFSFTTQPLKAPAAAAPTPPPAAPEPPMPAEPAAPIAFAPPAARQVTPPPLSTVIPQRSITPAAPANGTNGTTTNGNGHGHSHAMPTSPLSPRSITPSNGNGNGNGHNGNGNGNGHGLPLPPGLRLGPLNGNHAADLPPTRMAPAPAPMAEPTPPAPNQPTIFAALRDLCGAWPEELKNEVLNSPLAGTSVPLDGAIIVPGLKRGRVVMSWKQLRILAQPGSSPSVHDLLEVELPLRVIAPLFMAAQKAAQPKAKTSVSEEIPDLFFGFPQPAAPPPPAPILPPLPRQVETPSPVTPPLVRPPEPKLPTLKLQDTNFYPAGDKAEATQAMEIPVAPPMPQQTDFMNRQAHPKDVVARAAALPGVAGSVVAMHDGLRVASQAPSDLNADALAAFLPQIFERVNQSTRELRMGALNNLNFTVGNVPWKIFRVNSVYFAAFGKAGEQFPSAQLAQLAAELDRKK